MGQFDEAFISRVQLALPYRPLDQRQRLQIWENFLRRLEAVEEPMDIASIRKNVSDLSLKELNGREIRNVIKIARQLARFENTKMSFDHLQRVIQVSRRFSRYMDEIENYEEVKSGNVREKSARENKDR